MVHQAVARGVIGLFSRLQATDLLSIRATSSTRVRRPYSLRLLYVQTAAVYSFGHAAEAHQSGSRWNN